MTISGVAGTFGASGNVSVSPSSTTTYTLTASGPGNCSSIQLQTTVTVGSCPTVAGSTFNASPSSIAPGGSSSLTWNVPNATSVTISGVPGTFCASGSVVVSPASSTTYTLTASGPGTCAAVTLQTTVTVNQPLSITGLSAAPNRICAGQSSTLTWSSTGGTSATITDMTSGTVTNVPVNGSLVVTPPTTRTYRLSVTNSVGTVTQDVPVTVNPLAVINSFFPSPSSVNAGQSASLFFDVSNTTSRTITDLTTGTVTNLATESGNISVTPPSTRTYRLTAVSGCNSITQDVVVTVTTCPTAAGSTFTASPNAITGGQSSILSWNVPNATQVTISGVPGTFGATGSVSVSPTSTTTYTLTASNGTCSAVTLQTTVTVNAIPGDVLIGPQNQPAAVGPTDNNDDYTNLTMSVGVAVPAGGVTTSTQTITFINTVRNNSTVSDTVTISLRSVFSVSFANAYQISLDGGATYQSFTIGTNYNLTIPAQSNFDVRVRVQMPSGQAVLQGFPAVIRVTSGITPSVFNETIDRAWTGFIRADKFQSVTNSTGVGSATDAVPGAVITYTVSYSNVTTQGGTGNVNLTATNLQLTDDGTALPNNWAGFTSHVAGSASDSRGGAITGDVAGSTLLRDTVPSLAPGQSGVFQFRRVIK